MKISIYIYIQRTWMTNRNGGIMVVQGWYNGIICYTLPWDHGQNHRHIIYILSFIFHGELFNYQKPNLKSLPTLPWNFDMLDTKILQMLCIWDFSNVSGMPEASNPCPALGPQLIDAIIHVGVQIFQPLEPLSSRDTVLCWRGSSMVISWRVPKIWDLHVKISLGCSSTWFLYGHIYIYVCI